MVIPRFATRQSFRALTPLRRVSKPGVEPIVLIIKNHVTLKPGVKLLIDPPHLRYDKGQKSSEFFG